MQSKPRSVDIDKQQPFAVVDELPGGQAVLISGGITVGAGENQPAFFPAFGQQLIEVGAPRPVMPDVTRIAVPGILAPFRVGGQLGPVAVALVEAQQPWVGVRLRQLIGLPANLEWREYAW